MKDTNFLFLRALRAALRGEKADLEKLSPEQWMEILHIAQIHKVLPMILDAVHNCPGMAELDGPELALFRRTGRQPL